MQTQDIETNHARTTSGLSNTPRLGRDRHEQVAQLHTAKSEILQLNSDISSLRTRLENINSTLEEVQSNGNLYERLENAFSGVMFELIRQVCPWISR